MENNYNPDVLNCIANLSNDEVFTPPELVNQMLDLLPQDLFRKPETTFLDPFTKSGVFLREIVKRLDTGLAAVIPDRQERILHIMHKQVFGIALTELTSLLSRRTVYCSKYADSDHSIGRFKTKEGHILYTSMQHTWQNGRCIYCGASKDVYDRGDAAETYAYNFIHTNNPKSFFNNMTFDVIIGNPPYQLSKATENSTDTNSAFASAIYPMFIDQALKLKPTYLCMITPSRWMTKAGQGISDSWVSNMLKCNHFVEIHDFLDASECFAGVEIKGGVNYFLYQESYTGKCKYVLHNGDKYSTRIDYLDALGAGVVIRDPLAMDILDKIISKEGRYYKNSTFESLVSPQHFFDKDGQLGTRWKDYSLVKDNMHTIKYYLNKRIEESGVAWVKLSDIPKNTATIPLHKVYIPEAGGSGNDDIILGRPFYGEPNSICSQTYIVIGYDPKNHNLSKEQCMNIIQYMKTRFVRYLVSIKKKTQHAPASVYSFVPLQDFSKPWTDEKLYKKYNLSEEEIAFIESMIRPME